MSNTPLSIVLQAAISYADEIEGRNHDDTTITKGKGIRAAAAQLSRPGTINVALLRQQRDWLLSLTADTPAELGRMVKAGAEHLDGLVNLLDATLDSEEGYASPLERVGEQSVEHALAFLIALLPDLQDLTPARLELSIEDGTVTAQVLADQIAFRSPGRAENAPAALCSLVETIKTIAKEGRRRRPCTRRRS